MTINSIGVVQGPYYPNGDTTTFPFEDFEVVDTGEVSAEIDGVEVDPASFAVNLNDDGTGQVVFFTPPAGDGATNELFLYLDPDFKQQTTLANQGPYFQKTIERVLDRLASRAIWLRDKILRAPVVPLDFADYVGKYPFVLPDGTIGWSAGTGADASLRGDLGIGEGELIGMGGGSTLKDVIQWVTPAMFGVFANGNQASDVTAQMLLMAAYATATKRPVKLDARTYRVSTKLTFTTPVCGRGTQVGGTLIQSTSTAISAASLHVIEMLGDDIYLKGVRVDGNVSADPAPWNSGNYDSFTGSRGVRIVGTGIKVSNVRVQNVQWAGFLVDFGSFDCSFDRCRAVRCRGNFGDGFIAMDARGVEYTGCRATDFTRIGFVADTYGDAPNTYSAYLTYDHCWAENGHDASILHGGGEYNAGFWAEKSGSGAWINCHSKNTYHRGYVMVSGQAVDDMREVQYSALNCTSSGSDTGFVVQSLASIPTNVQLSNCAVKTAGTTAFAFTSAANDTAQMLGCRATLSGTGSARSSIKMGLGTLTIDGFVETWETVDAGLRDAADQYYASLGHFGNAVGKVVVRDWRTVDNAGAVIPSVFKFLAPAGSTLDLNVTRCYLRGVQIVGGRIVTRGVDWQRLGSMDCPDVDIEDGSTLETDSAFSIVIRLATKQVRFRNVRFDLTASAKWLALFNIDNTSPRPKISLNECEISKNFETGGNAIVLTPLGGPAGALAGTTGANNILMTDNVITNVGGATATAAVVIDSNTDAGGKLHGRGNLMNLTNAIVAGKLAAASSFEALG